jgi:hypothetical protein
MNGISNREERPEWLPQEVWDQLDTDEQKHVWSYYHEDNLYRALTQIKEFIDANTNDNGGLTCGCPFVYQQLRIAHAQ